MKECLGKIGWKSWERPIFLFTIPEIDLRYYATFNFWKNKICLNRTKSLVIVNNPILSAKKWGFCDETVCSYLTSPFFLQCYKPQ